jgi:hypothetical protein
VLDRTDITGRLWADQRAGIATALVFEACRATDIGVLEGHSEPGLAQRQALVVELAEFSAPFAEWNGSEGLVDAQIVAVEVFVHIPRIKSGIEGTISGPKAKAVLDIGHKGMKVGHVGLIERKCEFGQDKLSPSGNLGGDDTRAVAPVELSYANRIARHRVIKGRRWWFF